MSAMKFPPNVALNGTGRFSRDVNESIKEVEKKLEDIDKRIATLNVQFDDLQVLANDVAEKYEKTASRPDFTMDRKSLLEDILDHKLPDGDIRLMCRYIKHLETIILRSIWKKDSKFTRIRSIPQIHKERNNDWSLYTAYDEICGKLNISNSGKPNSCVYQLFSFLQDCQPRPLTYKPHTSRRLSTMDPQSLKIRNDENSSDEKTSGKPEYIGNLTDESVVDYALSIVSSNVQNIQLAGFLKSCILVVKEHFLAPI